MFTFVCGVSRDCCGSWGLVLKALLVLAFAKNPVMKTILRGVWVELPSHSNWRVEVLAKVGFLLWTATHTKINR